MKKLSLLISIIFCLNAYAVGSSNQQGVAIIVLPDNDYTSSFYISSIELYKRSPGEFGFRYVQGVNAPAVEIDMSEESFSGYYVRLMQSDEGTMFNFGYSDTYQFTIANIPSSRISDLKNCLLGFKFGVYKQVQILSDTVFNCSTNIENSWPSLSAPNPSSEVEVFNP